MSAVLATPPFLSFQDNDGNPLAGGLIYTYAAGTTTPKATYTDSTGLVSMSNPIVLDSSGRSVWWLIGSYKYVVKDSLGNTIRTTDNVTSFSTLADEADAFFQSFSGTGSQTAFTLSTGQGTDSKGLMIFVNKGLQQTVTNGSFTTDTDWTKGAGWTIGAGVATAAGAISTAISQTAAVTLVEGQAYSVTYTITRSAGGLIPSVGGRAGTERTASGTYTEVIVCGSSQTIAFTGNAFTGTLDTISITVAATAGYDIVSPSSYTVSGTSLTFSTAPALGTNNIYVFAPSSLLGAASSAAAAAEASAAAALTSQTEAAASAALAATTVKWKPAVACATTANITLSGEQTIDTVLTSASRVLVKDQTTATQNGVYVSAAGAWTRATDADTWDELTSQAVFTSGGSANINKSWVNTNESGGTIGVDNITWTQLQAFGDMSKAVYDSANIAQQMVGTTATQTLTNKSLSDSTTFIVDNSDATKKLAFECSGITTATTRTVTIPDKSGTLAMTTDTGCIQHVSTQTGAVATGSTTIPLDDTIPQSTEGDQYMTLAVTPTSATNILVIDVVVNFSTSGGVATGICALFQDATAGALAAAPTALLDNRMVQISFRHKMTAGTTSATTFKVRLGSSAAGTITLNGAASARLLGGVMASSINIYEYTT